MSASPTVAAIPESGANPTWERATDAFLRRDLAAGTRRVYRLTLGAVGVHLDDQELATVTAAALGRAVGTAFPDASPATWNRVVATLRSFWAFARKQGWTQVDAVAALERRRVVEDHSRALSREELDRLLTRRTASLRDRCLWRMLYETGARANEVLNLNMTSTLSGPSRSARVATATCSTSKPARRGCCPE